MDGTHGLFASSRPVRSHDHLAEQLAAEDHVPPFGRLSGLEHPVTVVADVGEGQEIRRVAHRSDRSRYPPPTRILQPGDAGECGAVVAARGDAVLLGDASVTLLEVPDATVQTVVTSPPYWSLRDYAVDGQIGMAEPLHLFLKKLVTIFDQVGRVLAPDGTVWVNIGDSYTSGNRGWRAPDRKNPARAMRIRPANPEGTKDKELIGVPWRFALAMQEAGWWLRSDIIWYKPNCQPESVRDRPTRSHEHVFLFTKSERYHYDVDAVRGPNGRRLRDVWALNTTGFPGAHFATFPPEVVRRCVLIGSRPGDYVLDPFLGSGTTAAVASELGRPFIGCELNESYLPLIQERTASRPLTSARWSASSTTSSGSSTRTRPSTASPTTDRPRSGGSPLL
ncbi:MAG: site-specific DNA-methyltransferase [Acidimicrobiaceae bacterium]|nr:site-specific DNA-methyltransferase [Acidimicrobiaceae bacterium]